MYFTKKGKENTTKTLEIAIKAANERNIGHIVVASNTGATAMGLKGAANNVVCVSHVNGMIENGVNELTAEDRQTLKDAKIKVLTTTHVLSGVERGISRSAGGMYPAEIMANTLRMFGAGVKVCVEIAIMALDAGLVPYGQPIIAIGGTGRGADTAVILTPSHAQSVMETKIHEILCKPGLY